MKPELLTGCAGNEVEASEVWDSFFPAPDTLYGGGGATFPKSKAAGWPIFAILEEAAVGTVCVLDN